MTYSLKQHLIDARALIDTPEKWTKGVLAKTKFGRTIGPLEKNAFCFCTLGALKRAGGGNEALVKTAVYALRGGISAADYSGPWFIADWNDSPARTHAEVIAAFDKAIEVAA